MSTVNDLGFSEGPIDGITEDRAITRIIEAAYSYAPDGRVVVFDFDSFSIVTPPTGPLQQLPWEPYD